MGNSLKIHIAEAVADLYNNHGFGEILVEAETGEASAEITIFAAKELLFSGK